MLNNLGHIKILHLIVCHDNRIAFLLEPCVLFQFGAVEIKIMCVHLALGYNFVTEWFLILLSFKFAN